MDSGTTSRAFRPRAVLLDFYGTLVEEDDAVIRRIAADVAGTSPARPSAEAVASFWSDQFKRLCGRSFAAAFRPQRNIATESLRETMEEFGVARPAAQELCDGQFQYWRQPKILPGVKSVLTACPVPVCLVSNIDSDDLKAALCHVGLRFDMVVTSEECQSYKPRPEMFQKALSLLGMSAGDVLHVGDSIGSDIAGAKAAGIPVLWINPTSRQAPAELTPDYVSRDLTGLMKMWKHSIQGANGEFDSQD